MANTRIKKDSRYIFGPVPNGSDVNDIQSGEMVSFVRQAENGMNYPREYAGSYFLETLNVTTFDEYLSRNPERLKPGRRFFFYEKGRTEEDANRLVHSGTMMHGDAAQRGQGLSDPATPAPAQQPVVIQTQSDRGSRQSFEDIINAQREDITRLQEQLSQQHAEVARLQQRVIEAERLRIEAEANLSVANQRKDDELEKLRASYEQRITMMKEIQSRDLEILQSKAADAATRAAEQTLRDAEPVPSTGEKAMEVLADVMPMVQPVIEGLGQFMRDYLQDKAEERRIRRNIRLGLPVAQPSTPVATLPEPTAPVPTQTNPYGGVQATPKQPITDPSQFTYPTEAR